MMIRKTLLLFVLFSTCLSVYSQSSIGFMYFNEKVDGFYQTEEQYRENQKTDNRVGWDFDKNPLDVYHTGSRDVYYDYASKEHRELINNNLRISLDWYDYIMQGPLGIPIAGGIHAIVHANNRMPK